MPTHLDTVELVTLVPFESLMLDMAEVGDTAPCRFEPIYLQIEARMVWAARYLRHGFPEEYLKEAHSLQDVLNVEICLWVCEVIRQKPAKA
ncbi:MAG: hypothetical protein HN348_09065 [Proteobacteria bacterium]|jgi:hypothetical protein|nr:hypothetical protein [Pseudomonadota bacterium]